MAARVRLILTLHNHQPIGNFDGVFEGAYQDSYAPFLNILDEFPDLPVVLHISGSLMEWLTERHPEYIERIRGLVARGQIELLGGPFYESILACIPRRDRIGQIREYKKYLEQLFSTTVRGMWVPERVWEQSFAGDIAEAGMKAMQEEAEQLMTNSAVKLAYEQFLLVCELSKDHQVEK